MYPTTKIILSIALVIVIASGIYTSQKRNQSTASTQTPVVEKIVKKEVTSTVPAIPKTTSGSYEIYSAEKIAKASSGPVVLFFKAGWCPSCRTVDADIKAHVSEIPAHLTILEVNYDNASDLKKKYAVTYQHTFVQVDADGALIKKWSGSPTLSALISEIK